jgi:CMP-N-acetylneuraminic acid synthetase
MTVVLGLVPARGGSKGVPGKNVRPLHGRSLVAYAAAAARESAVCTRIVMSTDAPEIADEARRAGIEVPFLRPPALAQDDTPMLAVIGHTLDALHADGWSPDVIVLLQPTSPLRQPSHIRRAVALLEETGADSVVTVVAVPAHLSPDYVMRVESGALQPYLDEGRRVTRRQDARPEIYRDGTVYAFRRSTVERFGDIYGATCRPLILEAAESLSIDTPADWDEAERRLAAREQQAPLP